MSDRGASASDGSISELPNSKSAALVSGSNASYRHGKSLQNAAQRYREAHPNCRIQLCIQSGYSAKDIALLFTYNMGSAAGVKLVQNELIQRCAELSGHTVVPRLRDLLAGGTPAECNFLLKAVELSVKEGKLAPDQVKCFVRGMQGTAADDSIGEPLEPLPQPAVTRRYPHLPVGHLPAGDSAPCNWPPYCCYPCVHCGCRSPHDDAGIPAAAQSEDSSAGGRGGCHRGRSR